MTDLVQGLPSPDASIWGSSRSAARSLLTAQGQTDNRDTIWGMPATELGDGIFSKNCSLTQSGSLVPKPRRSARCQDEILRARSLQSLNLNYSTLLYSSSPIIIGAGPALPLRLVVIVSVDDDASSGIKLDVFAVIDNKSVYVYTVVYTRAHRLCARGLIVHSSRAILTTTL